MFDRMSRQHHSPRIMIDFALNQSVLWQGGGPFSIILLHPQYSCNTAIVTTMMDAMLNPFVAFSLCQHKLIRLQQGGPTQHSLLVVIHRFWTKSALTLRQPWVQRPPKKWRGRHLHHMLRSRNLMMSLQLVWPISSHEGSSQYSAVLCEYISEKSLDELTK